MVTYDAASAPHTSSRTAHTSEVLHRRPTQPREQTNTQHKITSGQESWRGVLTTAPLPPSSRPMLARGLLPAAAMEPNGQARNRGRRGGSGAVLVSARKQASQAARNVARMSARQHGQPRLWQGNGRPRPSADELAARRRAMQAGENRFAPKNTFFSRPGLAALRCRRREWGRPTINLVNWGMSDV